MLTLLILMTVPLEIVARQALAACGKLVNRGNFFLNIICIINLIILVNHSGKVIGGVSIVGTVLVICKDSSSKLLFFALVQLIAARNAVCIGNFRFVE